MQPRLIGLCGAAGAGKDTVAAVLTEHYGYHREAFADRMRTAMLALDPIVMDGFLTGPRRLSQVVELVGWDDAKRVVPEIRRLLQRFGTEAGRDVHGKDCWVNALFNSEGPNVRPTVITDVRFSNEAAAVRKRGGLVVQIIRPGLAALPGNHTSEAGIPPMLTSYVIQNSGSLADLEAEVHNLIEWSTAA